MDWIKRKALWINCFSSVPKKRKIFSTVVDFPNNVLASFQLAHTQQWHSWVWSVQAGHIFCTGLTFDCLMLPSGNCSYSVLPYEHRQTTNTNNSCSANCNLMRTHLNVNRWQAWVFSQSVPVRNALLALLLLFLGLLPRDQELNTWLTLAERDFLGPASKRKSGLTETSGAESLVWNDLTSRHCPAF